MCHWRYVFAFGNEEYQDDRTQLRWVSSTRSRANLAFSQRHRNSPYAVRNMSISQFFLFAFDARGVMYSRERDRHGSRLLSSACEYCHAFSLRGICVIFESSRVLEVCLARTIPEVHTYPNRLTEHKTAQKNKRKKHRQSTTCVLMMCGECLTKSAKCFFCVCYRDFPASHWCGRHSKPQG